VQIPHIGTLITNPFTGVGKPTNWAATHHKV